MRAIWTGSLSFGLINIPIHLYSASVDRSLSFTLLDKHGNCPISFVRVCRANHKEVPYEDIVKGYQYQKGDYVVLDDKDFAKVAPKKTGLIEIVQFSGESDVEPKYYERPYYIEPDKRSIKAYVLLVEALKQSKKIAIAKFVLRKKEHMAVIKPDGDTLVLHQLRYHNEIRENELSIPKNTHSSDKELQVALAFIKQLTKKFKPTDFHDTYTEELEEIIEAKAKGKRVRVAAKSHAPHTTQMKDLMSLLQKSLEKVQ